MRRRLARRVHGLLQRLLREPRGHLCCRIEAGWRGVWRWIRVLQRRVRRPERYVLRCGVRPELRSVRRRGTRGVSAVRQRLPRRFRWVLRGWARAPGRNVLHQRRLRIRLMRGRQLLRRCVRRALRQLRRELDWRLLGVRHRVAPERRRVRGGLRRPWAPLLRWDGLCGRQLRGGRLLRGERPRLFGVCGGHGGVPQLQRRLPAVGDQRVVPSGAGHAGRCVCHQQRLRVCRVRRRCLLRRRVRCQLR